MGRSRREGGVAFFQWNNFDVALEKRGVDSNELSVLVELSTGNLATGELLVPTEDLKWNPEKLF